MNTSDPNAFILNAAEYTVRVAKKELGKTLDYSTKSLGDFDALIEHIKSHFLTLKEEGKLTEQTIQRASVSLGGYLGEIIRRQYGGTWASPNNVLYLLRVNEQEVSPILYVYQRVFQNSDYGIKKYWSDLDAKVHPQENTQKEDTSREKVREAEKPILSAGNTKILIIAGIGIAALCFMVVLGGLLFSNIRAMSDFRSKLNPFLSEAEKLNTMTEQGINYQEFRIQLIEVKSKYASIDSWPSSYKDDKRSLDLALKGWDYALQVWEIKLGVNDPLHFQSFYGTPLVYEMGDYLGLDKSHASALVEDDWIERLMGQASIYFEGGLAGMK